jgi:hypothetical protein
MATTTPNYGWTVPTSTDLVKDGATAIETLGDAIDASMNTALGTKKAGMVLLNTTSFSAVSSMSFPNNTLSATYEYYKVIIDLTASSATSLFWRGRAAGSDNSSSNYMWMKGLYNSNSTPGSSFGGSGGLTTWGTIGDVSGSSICTADFVGLFATQKAAQVFNSTKEDGATGIAYTFGGSGMSVTTSYDSISILTSSGTMTGMASIYGYNK